MSDHTLADHGPNVTEAVNCHICYPRTDQPSNLEPKATRTAEPRTVEVDGRRFDTADEAIRWLIADHTKAELTDLIMAMLDREAEAAAPAGLDVDAMTETLRYLYHADDPCNKEEHRHWHMAQGIVGQYPRFAARLLEGRPEEEGSTDKRK